MSPHGSRTHGVVTGIERVVDEITGFEDGSMSTTLRYEDARPADSELVAEIVRRSFQRQAEVLGLRLEDHPRYVAFETAERVERRMESGCTIVLATLGSIPIGTVGFRRNAQQEAKGSIERLAVLPEWRGSAHGAALMRHAESRLQGQGVTLIEVSIVAGFEGLHRFYEGLGYAPQETKRFPGLPFDVRCMTNTVDATRGS